MPLSPDQRERVLSIFRRFLAQRLANLDKLSLDKLTFNVIALARVPLSMSSRIPTRFSDIE